MKIWAKKSLRITAIIIGTAFITITVIYFYFYPKLKRIYHQKIAESEAFKTGQNFVLEENTYCKEKLLEKAKEYNRERHFERAIEYLTRILESEPNDKEALSARAQNYEAMNQFDLALADYNKIIETDPEDTDTLFARASVYESMDQPEKYKEELDKVLKVHNDKIAREPENTEFLQNRAWFYRQTNQDEKSNEDFKLVREILDKKIEKNPNDLEAREERVSLVFGNNFFVFEGQKDNIEDWKTVISDYSILLKRDPNDADMYANRGTAYYRVGEYDKAADDYIMANKLKPKPYYISPGYGHYDKTIPHEKYNDDEEGYEDTPNNGAFDINSDNYDRPIAFYTKLIEKNPKAARAYFYRGWAYSCKKEYDKALPDYTKMIELYPDDPEAYTKRGWAYDNTGKYVEAIADFSKLIEMRPTDEVAYLSRSEAYLKNKQYDESIADCNKVIERLHEIAYPNFRDDGIKEPTQEQLDKEIIGFLSVDPEFVGAYYTKGEAYEGLGNKAEAIKAYKEYIKYGKEAAATKSGLKEAKERIKALEKK